MVVKYFEYPMRVRLMPRCDVVHLLDHSYAHLLRAVRHGTPIISTLHDLAPLRERAKLSHGQVARFRRICMNLHRSTLILSDSEASRQDANQLLGIPFEIMEVLPLGVDTEKFAESRAPIIWDSGVADSFRIFSVGSVQARKNLEIVPSVLECLAARGLKVSFVRAGERLPSPLREGITAIIGNERLVEKGSVSESDLISLYQSSNALFMPSRIEGYGFPVVEAMAAGCPVVCSHATSLAEVAGGAALVFAPDDAQAAANHLAAVAEDPDLSRELRRKGLARAKELSWNTYFEKLVEYYRRVSHDGK